VLVLFCYHSNYHTCVGGATELAVPKSNTNSTGINATRTNEQKCESVVHMYSYKVCVYT